MGTSKPLNILVHPDFILSAWVEELQAKGHTVRDSVGDDGDWAWQFDLILAPQACRFVPGMEFLLDEVVKGARKVRYPKEPR